MADCTRFHCDPAGMADVGVDDKRVGVESDDAVTGSGGTENTFSPEDQVGLEEDDDAEVERVEKVYR